MKSSALRGGLRYSKDMLISRFRCRGESPREHSREDECRVCHHCGIKSMPTPNDLGLHACLRDKFIAFRQPYERSHHHDTHWKECSCSSERSAERALPSPHWLMRPSLSEWRDYSCCRYNVEVRVPYTHSLCVVHLHCVFSLLSS